MINIRPWIGWVTAVACCIGCSSSTVNPVVPEAAAVAATEMNVTFYLPNMCERLHLLWNDWPNQVIQALEGLDAVEVENEWDRDPELIDLEDLLFVTYNPERVTIDQLLQTIREQGFEAQVREP